MKEVRLVDSTELNFNLRGETLTGTAYVARALGEDVSPNLGIGFARWEGAEIEWKVLYDEVVFVIEGCFELNANGQQYHVKPGQMLYIPEGTALVYGGHAVFGYVVYPGNWKQIHGIT